MKDLLPYMRIWAKILMGCVHHRKPTNFADCTNDGQQYVFYYIAIGKKVNLHSLLFQYLRVMVKETIDGIKKKRNFTPFGRLILEILI